MVAAVGRQVLVELAVRVVNLSGMLRSLCDVDYGWLAAACPELALDGRAAGSARPLASFDEALDRVGSLPGSHAGCPGTHRLPRRGAD